MAEVVDPQESSFARKLLEKKHCLVMFYSGACSLCRSLEPSVQQVEDSEGAWLEVARMNADQHKLWGPELLRYNVLQVPCFVLLDEEGNSLCKSKPPRGKQHMLETLGQMLERSGHKTSHGSKGSSKD